MKCQPGTNREIDVGTRKEAIDPDRLNYTNFG